MLPLSFHSVYSARKIVLKTVVIWLSPSASKHRYIASWPVHGPTSLTDKEQH